jgi:hypothetical protein
MPMRPSSPPVTPVHFQMTAYTIIPNASVSIEK